MTLISGCLGGSSDYEDAETTLLGRLADGTGDAIVKVGSKIVVYDDMKAGPEVDAITSKYFDSLNDRYAYTAAVNDKEFIVVGGQIVSGLDRVQMKGSKYRGFIGGTVTVNPGTYDPMSGIEELIPPEVPVSPAVEFSIDGRHSFFIGWKDGSAHVVYDGQIGKAYEKIHRHLLSWKGTRLIYVGYRNEKQIVNLDGQEVGSYGYVDYLDFSKNEKHAAWAVHDDGQNFVVLDGQR